MEIRRAAVSLVVSEASQAGEVRRTASQFARLLNASDEVASNVGILATEAANNLWKHGGGGEILINHFSGATGSGVEVIAMDKGAGMANPAECLKDGYST